MKRIFTALMSALVVFSLLLNSTYASGEFTPAASIDVTDIFRVINLYSNDSSITYDISSSIKLKSFSTNDYEYTLYRLTPHGYAIIHNNTGALMEANYSSDAVPPYDLNQRNYYYGGPFNYFKQENGAFVHTTENITINNATINQIASMEQCAISYVNTVHVAPAETTSISVTSANDTSNSVAAGYFSTLSDFGTNSEGTCTVIAFAILLGYYDNYCNDDLIASEYEQNSGTTENFHQLLNDYVYGVNGTHGGIFIHDAVSGINSYLSSRNLTMTADSVYSTANNARTKILAELADGNPVVASMAEAYGADWNHSVVVYGATYDSDAPLSSAVLKFHCGWNQSPSYNEMQASIGWFYECGFISCTYGHTFGPWVDSDTEAHCRICVTCSYQERETHNPYWNSSLHKCTRCGRTDPILEEYALIIKNVTETD